MYFLNFLIIFYFTFGLKCFNLPYYNIMNFSGNRIIKPF